jgi:hypothetical protein
MKRLLLQRLFLLLLPLALVACAERRQDVDNDAPATLDAASEQVRTDATRAAEDLDRRIAALERSAEAATGEARERYNETLNELRLKRTALQADLDRFATVTQDDFDDLRDDVAEKQAELEADLDEATLRLADTKADFEAAARRRMAALDRDIERLEANASWPPARPKTPPKRRSKHSRNDAGPSARASTISPTTRTTTSGACAATSPRTWPNCAAT